jgi:predicted NBD/HSP70 family sugar kinase
VGVVITGIYDEKEQMVVNSSNPLLENVKLLDYLPGLHSRLVCIENESNLGALALTQSYRNTRIRDLIFIHIGSGLGCGILSQNRLLKGSRGYGVEIAHIPLLDTSVKCYCGKVGCIESLLSVPGILAHYNSKEELTSLNYDRKELARFIDAVGSGEERALSIIQTAGSKMGQLAAILANIFDPKVIFLSGEVETLVELIFMAAQPYFSRSLLLSQRRKIDFQIVKSIKELFYAGAAEKVFRRWLPFSN